VRAWCASRRIDEERRNLTRTFSLAVVSAALLLSGCGGGSSASTSFRAQADKICAATGARTTAIPAPGDTLGSAEAAVNGEIPIAASELASLKALTPPAAQAAQWTATLNGLSRAQTLRGLFIAAVHDGTPAELRAAPVVLQSVSQQIRATASRLGLAACAVDYEPSG